MKCPICEKTFRIEKLLNNHRNRAKFNCDKCGQQFCAKMALNHHRKELLPPTCSNCEKVFESDLELSIHSSICKHKYTLRKRKKQSKIEDEEEEVIEDDNDDDYHNDEEDNNNNINDDKDEDDDKDNEEPKKSLNAKRTKKSREKLKKRRFLCPEKFYFDGTECPYHSSGISRVDQLRVHLNGVKTHNYSEDSIHPSLINSRTLKVIYEE